MTSGTRPGRAPRLAGWFARRTIRARLVLLGVAALAAALALVAVAVYAVLTASLSASVGQGARASAEQVALLVNAGRVPDPVPVAGAQVVQILDAQGRVVTGSVTADRLTALVTTEELRIALAGEAVVVPGSRTGLAGRLQVAAVAAGPATPSGRAYSVVAAAPTTDIERSARTVRDLLLWTFPVVLVLLALTMWPVVGAALAPVEALRRGAERIDESSSDSERLPVPTTRDEIGALAVTLNAMLDRVASARRTQRAFVADAAHELRSPLASMRTQLDVARHLGEGGELPASLLADVDRITRLVDDLLLLARADDATVPRRPAAPVDLGPVVADVVSRYAAARVPVRTQVDAGDLRAVAVVDDVSRALTNLLDNAVRHARSTVVVGARTEGPRLLLLVTDDGHGIPAADRERVFDRFTRLDEARDRDSGGSGLGLAITRALVRRSGGEVRLEDASPGVRAVITLPRA